MTKLDAALFYARLGLAVFPLHYPANRRCSCGNVDCGNAAKHPYGRLAPKGCHSASKDPRVIERWFDGTLYNLGIHTGAGSGIIVIDVDPRHGGDQTLVELERRYGPLPTTWRFITGSGGSHNLFRHPGGTVPNSAGKIGLGIDVRGDGGLIVAPPSLHVCGRQYAISVDHHPDDVPLADMPEWLVTLVHASAPRTNVVTMPEIWRRLIAEGVTEGRRNAAIARLAGHLLRKRIDPLVVLDLCRSWNACRCRPPLDDAEVVRTVNSIAGREIARRGASHHA